MFGKKVKLPDELYALAKKYSETAGYSSIDEFIVHCIEKEIKQRGSGIDEEKIKDRLKGLGYLS